MKKITLVFLIFVISLMLPTLSLSQEAIGKHSKLEVLDYPLSFAELLKKFKGKVVYIDVMASWCPPCLMELKEAKKLESYFEKNNIVKLYITIDNFEDIGNGFKAIQKESLSGYFTSWHSPIRITSGGIFEKELEDLFFRDENGNHRIAIPQYVIVNRKGQIVEKRAKRPSNPEGLKKQLEQYL